MFNVNSFYRKDVLKLHYWAVFTKTTKKNHIISIIFHNKKLWVPDFSLSVVRFPCYSLWMQRLKLQWHSRMCSIAPELSYFPCWGYPLTSKKKKPLTSGQKRKKLTSIFYFHTSLWCLKRFYKGIKRFEALQRSAKKNIRLSEMHGTLRVILHEIKFSFMFYQDVLIDKKNVTHILQDKNLEKALIYWHKIFLNLLKIWKQF